MQNNQKIDLSENKELRRELTLKLVKMLNDRSYLPEEQWITDQQVEDFLNDEKIITDYKKARDFKKEEIAKQNLMKEYAKETEKKPILGVNRVLSYKFNGTEKSEENKQIYLKACTIPGALEYTEETLNKGFNFDQSKNLTIDEEEALNFYYENSSFCRAEFCVNSMLQGEIALNPEIEDLYNKNKELLESFNLNITVFENKANPMSLLIPPRKHDYKFFTALGAAILGFYKVLEPYDGQIDGLDRDPKSKKEYKCLQAFNYNTSKFTVEQCINKNKKFHKHIENGDMDKNFIYDKKIMYHGKELTVGEALEKEDTGGTVEFVNKTPEEKEKTNNLLKNKCLAYSISDALNAYIPFLDGLRVTKENLSKQKGLFTWNTKEFNQFDKVVNQLVKKYDQLNKKIDKMSKMNDIVKEFKKFYEENLNSIQDMRTKAQKYIERKALDNNLGKKFNDRTNKRLDIAKTVVDVYGNSPLNLIYEKRESSLSNIKQPVEFKKNEFQNEVVELSKAHEKELITTINLENTIE